jgi:GNAT superfamily N-acetyltransferase
MPNDHSPAPSIRAATLSDCEVIADFNRRLAAEAEDKRLEHEVVVRGVRTALSDPARCRYYLATLDGEIVGQTMITFEWSDWRNGWFWWIQSVYVHADFRKRGVYRTLHEHIAREARRTPDVCGLRLYVDTRNDAAMKTYEALGMIPGGYVLYETDWSDAVRAG